MPGRPIKRRHPSLHALAWSVFRSRRWLGASIVVGSLMHAAGQASLAAAAGVLARTLARGSDPMDAGSTPHVRMFGLSEFSDNVALVLASVGVFAAIVKLVGGALASWAEARVAGDAAAEVRLTVLDDVLETSNLRRPRHGDHGGDDNAGASGGAYGERLAALTSHIGDVERGVSFGVLSEFRAIVQLVPLGALLVVLAPRLASSALVALATFGMLAFLLRRAFKRAYRRAATAAGALVSVADEAVRHAELWATYGAKLRIRAHVAGVGRAIAREAARLRVRASLLSSTSEVLGALALLLALVLAASGTLGVDRGKVVPFAIVFFMAYRPLRELVDARLARARGEEALRMALGRSREVGVATPDEEPARVVEGRVEVAGRSAWPLAPLVLTAVRSRHGAHAPLSVEVSAGSIAAVVGPTGIGKTSLLRALLGLDPLAKGRVRYGDRALDDASVGPRERPFAWVPQDAPIVGDTLAINVALGCADDDVVPDPKPVLARLGNGALADALGEASLATRALSGGERQWIAVARALATGLPVLLLDEPTSALDSASQARLLDAIASLRGQRTVIMVTHRPEPLAIADVVIKLSNVSESNVTVRAPGSRLYGE